MTDISELVKRMRGLAEYVDDCDEAADALEAQAKEIEKLEEANVFCRSAFLTSKDRIAELEAALKPFAIKETEVTPERKYYDMLVNYEDRVRASIALKGES